ncbi:hypothetical protein GGX14DRAFT_602853 [Mycena pura]|uniref:F-box domain-containing protein n=1 Tax=Mycena pura TaxID=153505 RepID=A0AAD6VR15_9AGAR|nr:hypothetical protein GGX14DRAFT_602853 [Mycena pura]
MSHNEPAPTQRLPTELLLLTLEHLHADPETLKQACLVSKLWLHISQPCLFNCVCLSAPTADSPRTACAALYEVLSGSPHIAPFIRHITILGGPVLAAPYPSTIRWIPSDETLPALLDVLAAACVQSLHIRLSNERWRDLTVPLKASLHALVSSPTMHDVDLTGFDVVAASLFSRCRTLKRLKLSETANGILNAELVGGEDTDPWPATCESLTVLDTVHAGDIISWVIRTPSFRTLRELRLGFHPLDDARHVEYVLRYVGDTLESLHLQPVYSRKSSYLWPDPADFIAIGGLFALTSLRLSLGLSLESNPLPWAAFLLGTAAPARLQALTIDLRIGDARRDARQSLLALPWAALDAALSAPHLAGLRALTLTCFEYTPPFLSAPPASSPAGNGILAWFLDELPRLLPRSRARSIFVAYELSEVQGVTILLLAGPD